MYTVLKENSDMYFAPDKTGLTHERSLLVFVPDLDLNGAQTALFNLLRLFTESGYGPVIVSPADGAFRKKYTGEGYHVFIRNNAATSRTLRDHFSGYDLVLLNSSSVQPYAFCFINKEVPVFWWIHETREQLERTQQIPNPLLLGDNFHILCVSPKVSEGIHESFGAESDLLSPPIPDKKALSPLPLTDRVRFFMPAAYTPIKGQDILLDAVSSLPPEYIERSEFILCGYRLPACSKYYEDIKKLAAALPNVHMLDELDAEEMLKEYEKADCIVAPSRVDSLNSTVAEAMMCRRLVLVSSDAGISAYLKDCVNGFIFTNKDELFKRLLLIISDVGSLQPIADRGRVCYEELFTPPVVAETLRLLLKKYC